MKAVAIAIMLALVPAFAFAQAGVTAECPEGECHVVPFFKGSGGFVGELDTDIMVDGEEIASVGLIVTCGNINITASVDPDDDGNVAHLFTEDNGLACHQDDGEIQIHGLKDGGWYWIHDETNSAVSNLLPDRVLTNVQTAPFDVSGGDITMTSRDYATLVKDTTSGRVGILPHILPAAEPEKCGPMRSDCLLTGEYTLEIDNADGDSVKGTTITRGDDDMSVTASIGGEGNVAVEPANPVMTEFRTGGPGGTVVPSIYTDRGTYSPGSQAESLTVKVPKFNAASLTNANDPCRRNNQLRDTPISVVISAVSSTNTIPGFTTDGPTAMYHIACPPVPDASRGVELVPENPFPVD